MNTTRTASATRTRVTATVATLAGVTMALSACGGIGNAGSNGTWVAIESQSDDIVVIDGSKITYIDVLGRPDDACTTMQKAIDDAGADIEKLITTGKVDDTYQVMSTGTINKAETSVLWDDENGADLSGEDPGSGTIAIEDDMITLGYTFANGIADVRLVPVDSDQGEAYMAGRCG